MLIPSIDLMGGRIVQLVQGRKKALEFDNFEYWAQRFRDYPIVQLIDLDAAMGSGDNVELVAYFASRLPCQVGGGIRSLEKARSILKMGARKVIVGSSLLRHGQINTDFASSLAAGMGRERLIFATDSKCGKVATHGWQRRTQISPAQMIEALDRWCDAFLYTHIDGEGMMKGFPVSVIRELRGITERRLIAAGGITTRKEIESLHSMNTDAVVGMAIYKSVLAV